MIFIKESSSKYRNWEGVIVSFLIQGTVGEKTTKKDGLIIVFLLFTLLLWAEGQVLGEMKGI